MNTTTIAWLSEVGINDLEQVGGKNASLGEMIQHLGKLGIRIPNGYVITVEGYRSFCSYNHLEQQIRDLVNAIDHNSVTSLRRVGQQVRQLIRNSKFPPELSKQIIDTYQQLSANYAQEATDVAVRSSATAEDLPDASFAGQQETYLNVRGPAALMDAVRNCFASLFTDRAISYRQRFGYDHFAVGLSVCVQKMVRSDLGAAGVAFSLDPETGFRDIVVINGAFGLGEMVVQGALSPDEFIVFKPKLKEGYPAIIEKKLGRKDQKMVYGDNPDERVRIIPTEKPARSLFCIPDHFILQLAGWVCQIEDYYSNLKNHYCPMDIEWAVDGLSQQLYIVQARPETVQSRKEQQTVTSYSLSKPDGLEINTLCKGIAVGDKIASGKVNIFYSLDERVEGEAFREGDVLVTDMTDPDWEPIMKKASAIITNKGGRTCHAAIVAREMGVPAIVGCVNATEILQPGTLITASCAEGEEGFVYEGEIPFQKTETNLSTLPGIRTNLMLNVGSPAMAFQFAHLPHRGIGLAREEFIINNYIKAHPLALLHHHNLNDPALSGTIDKLIAGYKNERTYFIQKLSYGIARIAAAFYPYKVIVRFSDFKSNEYYNLTGGKYFEPKEENPMIGWRGASRYYSEEYKEAFGLECAAIKKVRTEMGLNNVVVMIPFCRTVDELLKVKATMNEYGLKQGEDGLEIYLMAELPSNILVAEEFARHVDGFSIGSNDLTQLTLGLDRDSTLVAGLYDERNKAVLKLIDMLIQTAREAGVKVGICGQGPSDHPDFAQFLVERGIDSISVTPDSLIKTVHAIHEVEKRMHREAPLTC
ncbi:phosphoenolpyruvate synthase [Filimonas effusa]|uniref:Phosphoenolpyruvate synthase n=1 Tax=Filimonas effusa TaxID=2508721 RepID=A0A4Q1D4Z7_9BACT|nr:phosphoenolpyruvate synthase [Filimonas effusa]RXK83418.1 phosphoenolpyruvate synthase [Filimonas effusa]